MENRSKGLIYNKAEGDKKIKNTQERIRGRENMSEMI